MTDLRDGETRDDAGHASALARTRAAQQREIAANAEVPVRLVESHDAAEGVSDE